MLTAGGDMFGRLAYCAGKGGRPSILISTSFEVYLGNLTNEELKLEPLDLFGFNTGQWEMKIIKGRVIGKHVQFLS